MARWRRRIFRIALGLFGLVVVVVALALVAAANLDARPMKGIVVGLAKDQGIALDFDEAGVTLGGLEVRNLRIASPESDAALAPDLVKIGSIDGRWSLFSKRVDDLVVSDLAVTIVEDTDGTTSLDRWLAQLPPSEPEPATPLSQLGQLLRIEGLSAKARIERVTVTVLRKGQDPIVLTGLEASAALENGLLTAGLGPSELRLTLGKKHAAVKLGLAAATTADGATLTLSADLVSQDLDPQLPPVKKILDLAATATFVPGETRTRVVLEKLHLLDGAVRVDAKTDLFDNPDASLRPVVHTLTAFVDLAAVARATPAQFGPLEVAGEPLRLSIEGVELTPVLKGKLTAAGKLDRVRYQEIEVAGLLLDATATPDGDGFQAKLRLPVEKLRMPDLAVDGVTLDLTATRAPGALPVDLDATVGVTRVEQPGLAVRDTKLVLDGRWEGGTSLEAKATVDVAALSGPAAVEGIHLEANLAGVTVAADQPLRSTGKLDLTGTVSEARVPGTGGASGVRWKGLVVLGPKPIAHVELAAARAAMPSLAESVGPDFKGAPLAVEVDATEIVLDETDLAKSRARAVFAGRFGGTRFAGNATGSASDLDFELDADAERAGPARGIKLVSKGHYGGTITQTSTLDVAQVAMPTARLSGAKVKLTSSGTLSKQKAEIALSADRVSVNGKALGQAKLDVDAEVDLDRPELDLHVRGRRPDADLKLGASLEGGAVRWSLDGKLGKLGALSGFLPEGPDWDRVVVDVSGKGTASGVIRRGPGGTFEVAPDPARTARGKQSLRVAVKELHYRGADEASADVAALSLTADVTLGDTKTAKIDLDVPALTAVQSGVHLNVSGFHARVDATHGRRQLAADVTVTAKELKQSALPSYPIRELSFRAKVSGDPEGALALETSLANAGAATELSAKGELERRADRAEDAVAGRHALVLEGKIDQSLDRLDGSPDELRGKGKVSIPFRIESGDLTLFRTSARLILTDVTVEMPRQQLVATNVRGELPIVQEIVLGENGVERVGSGANGVYQRLRFSDHRPYLGDADYLALDSVKYKTHQIGPLAGNIRVDRDIIAIDQLEMSALGGKIAGQVLVGLADKDTRIDFRGKVTGIRPTKGEERLDANAALSLIPYKQGMEGRIEIVRISKRHLKDLLDLYDPFHADVAANRVRLGLVAGYPKRVRLFFQSGFARMEVELGGLVGSVRIDPIEGIPIGPALSTWLAPVLETTK